MKLRQNLLFALTGWVVGILITLAMGLFILPATIGGPPTFETPDLLLLTFVVLVVSPFALAGGVIGGHLPKEGGRGDQIFMAIMLALVLAAPFSCIAFYYSGWSLIGQ